jgi:hypothetical protein
MALEPSAKRATIYTSSFRTQNSWIGIQLRRDATKNGSLAGGKSLHEDLDSTPSQDVSELVDVLVLRKIVEH